MVDDGLKTGPDPDSGAAGWPPAVPPTADPTPADLAPADVAPADPMARADSPLPPFMPPPTPGVSAEPPTSIPAPWQAAGPPPSTRSRFGRRLVIPVVVIGLVLGGVLLRPFLSGNASDLKTGDCFDDPIAAGQGGEVKDVQHRPCSDPHLFEVMNTVKFPADSNAAFPGSSGFDAFVTEKCSAAFLSFVGIADSGSTLTWYAYQPIEEGWKKGDRDVTRFLGTVDGSKLTATMKGTKR